MEWKRLTNSDDPDFSRAMELYQISFPVHEQRRQQEQVAALGHPEYHFDCLLLGGQFAGIILYWQTQSFIYVEHFCTEPALRGKGYGAQALDALGATGLPVILEVDPPSTEIARRRLGFYQRAGFIENPYLHKHPPYQAGHPPHDLVVLSRPSALGQQGYQQFQQYLEEVVMQFAE